MDVRKPSAEGVSFDRFRFHINERRLLRDGKLIALPAKAFDALAILISSNGEVVEREHLYQRLWPHAFVEDGNLTQQIYVLRKALDPNGDGRRFIQTVPRHGYRFAMPVSPIEKTHRSVPFTLSKFAAVFALAVTLLVAGSATKVAHARLDPQAALSYALGQYHWNMRTPSELKRSIVLFEQTVRMSPDSALGYAGLAEAYVIEADFTTHTKATKEYVRLAERYRDEALARDPDNAQAHAVWGLIAYRFRNDPALSEREFALALKAQPNDPTSHHWHATLRMGLGDISGAVREWELAHQLDPTSEVISRWLGIGYFYQRRPADAIRAFDETLSIQPADAEAWLSLADAQAQVGRFQEALISLDRARRSEPGSDTYVAVAAARLRAVADHGAIDRAVLSRIEKLANDPRAADKDVGQNMAYLFAAIGERDKAIAALRSSRPADPLDRAMEFYDPRLDTLRSDPRFQKLYD